MKNLVVQAEGFSNKNTFSFPRQVDKIAHSPPRLRLYMRTGRITDGAARAAVWIMYSARKLIDLGGKAKLTKSTTIDTTRVLLGTGLVAMHKHWSSPTRIGH